MPHTSSYTRASLWFVDSRRWLGLLMSIGLGLGPMLLLLAGVGLFGPIQMALAERSNHPLVTIIVTTSADELNTDGDCSLREALQAANTNAAVDDCSAGSGADAIALPAETYTLTIAGANEDANTTGDLDATDAAGLTISGAGASLTIINANAIDRALHAITGTLTLSDLTIQNGSATSGGGAYFGNTANVTDTNFINNIALFGGGAYFNGAASVANTTFISNTVDLDVSTGYGGDGGGAYFWDAASLIGTTFISNTADVFGGGAYFYYYYASPIASVTGSTFISNTATWEGGGAAFGRPVNMTSTTFLNNTANKGGGAVFGDTANINNSTFLSNTALWGGGGAYFYTTAGMTDTIFVNNIAAYNGGGLYLRGVSSTATQKFTNVLFTANHAGLTGAAIYASHEGGDDTLTLLHTTIASPTVGSGAAVAVLNGTVYITNAIVASYTLGVERIGGTVVEDYNLFDSVTTPYSGTITSGGNSITGTAAFYDTTWFTLTASSAAIDAGTEAGITTDYFGDPRPQGDGFDIGYDEFFGDTPISGLNATNDSPTELGSATNFTATISTGSNVTYQWDFGDGNAASGANAAHIYSAVGNYPALVTATNSLGSLSVITPITVTQPTFTLYLPLVIRQVSAPLAGQPTASRTPIQEWLVWLTRGAFQFWGALRVSR